MAPGTRGVEKDPCLGCGENCTGKQYSVHCTLCKLWCHKECAGLSDQLFKMLELQRKETGQAFWACRSCMNFASSITTKVQEVDKKVEELRGQVKENRDGIERTNDNVKKVEKKVERMERKAEDAERKSENGMYEEMRAREAIKRNLIIHGLEEPDSRYKTDKEKTEADLAECDKIFRATGGQARKRDIRFCRRIGERGQAKRPILLGMKTEDIKTDLLDRAPQLQRTDYKHVTIGPDQTRKQRKAEADLKEQMERKNREELTEEDRSKNLQWMVIGRKGEKRVVKAQAREEQSGEPGWRRGEWREQGNRRRQRGASKERRRTPERSSSPMEQESQDRSKRGRRSGTESEEEREEEPPRNKSKQ